MSACDEMQELDQIRVNTGQIEYKTTSHRT